MTCGAAPGGIPGLVLVPGDALGEAEFTCFCLIALCHVLWILLMIEKTEYFTDLTEDLTIFNIQVICAPVLLA